MRNRLIGVVQTPSPGGSPPSASTSGMGSAFRPPPLPFEPLRGCPQGESGLRGTSDPTVGGWERGEAWNSSKTQPPPRHVPEFLAHAGVEGAFSNCSRPPPAPRPPRLDRSCLVFRISPGDSPGGGSHVHGGGPNALHLKKLFSNRGLPPGEGFETTPFIPNHIKTI